MRGWDILQKRINPFTKRLFRSSSKTSRTNSHRTSCCGNRRIPRNPRRTRLSFTTPANHVTPILTTATQFIALVFAGGLIIKGPECPRPADFPLGEWVADKLGVDMILVVGHDALFSHLSEKMRGKIDVVNVPKSGGVVRLSAEERHA